MNGEAILAVSVAVVALTQLLKWAFLSDRWGPIAVLGLAALGVGFWIYSQNIPTDQLRGMSFTIFSGWISVATSAAGVYGFTRAAASAVTSATPPPLDGAGSSRTTDAPMTRSGRG
jgi:hypothetical protein